MLSCNKCVIFGLSLLISNINNREMYIHYACRCTKKLKIQLKNTLKKKTNSQKFQTENTHTNKVKSKTSDLPVTEVWTEPPFTHVGLSEAYYHTSLGHGEETWQTLTQSVLKGPRERAFGFGSVVNM